jgi:hypothetical protein
MKSQRSEGCIRIALQNPNGIRLTHALDVLPEVMAMDELDIDILTMPESKLSQQGRTREVLQRQLNVNLGSARVLEASAPKIKENSRTDYQPGGVLMAIIGKTLGRKVQKYRDPMGRFVWVKLRGNRNEGVLLITAYRVCQKRG